MALTTYIVLPHLALYGRYIQYSGLDDDNHDMYTNYQSIVRSPELIYVVYIPQNTFCLSKTLIKVRIHGILFSICI
jgi:hypothetical protein